jgi:7-carboxy-7-deazaguanine synthase
MQDTKIRQGSLILSEIYEAVQGEGRLTGVPSVFVRTSTCNLRCAWSDSKGNITKCDTPFTSWDPEIWKPTEEHVLKEITQYKGITHVVITGGEPLIQPKQVAYLTRTLVERGYHVTIETNGTKSLQLSDLFGSIDQGDAYRDKVLMSISPKLKSSVPVGTQFEVSHNRDRINKDTLSQLMSDYDSYLKFVIATDRDLEEVDQLVSDLKVPKDAVYLMPEGITPERIQEGALMLAPICIEKGYRYSDRLHVRIFGQKRRT